MVKCEVEHAETWTIRVPNIYFTKPSVLCAIFRLMNGSIWCEAAVMYNDWSRSFKEKRLEKSKCKKRPKGINRERAVLASCKVNIQRGLHIQVGLDRTGRINTNCPILIIKIFNWAPKVLAQINKILHTVGLSCVWLICGLGERLFKH